MSLHVMLFEATRMTYNPLDNRLYVFTMVSCGLIWAFNKSLDIRLSFIILNIIVMTCSLLFIANLIIELTGVLNIHCFKVK